jgi:AcrR family transcriptional regulator
MAGRGKLKAAPGPRYEQRKLEVLRGAARTFNRLGYHAATLEHVAEELGVTKPALYYYARSKDELLFTCGQMAAEALRDVLDDADHTDLSGLDRLVRFFRIYAEVICQDFGRCLVLTEPRDLAPPLRQEHVSGRRALNLAVRAMIGDGIGDGSIRPCDTRAVAIALFDAFNGLGRWYDAEGAASLQAIVDQYLAFALHGIAARADDGGAAGSTVGA